MRTKLVDGKLKFEPLSRQVDLQERYIEFCGQLAEYRTLSEKADAALKAANELRQAIDGVSPVEKPAK